MATEFRLPDLGENIEAGEVLNVLVSAGQTLSEDEPVIELETDKAVIEVPSSTAGKVVSVHVAKGDRATVGQVILTLEPATLVSCGHICRSCPVSQRWFGHSATLRDGEVGSVTGVSRRG